MRRFQERKSIRMKSYLKLSGLTVALCFRAKLPGMFHKFRKINDCVQQETAYREIIMASYNTLISIDRRERSTCNFATRLGEGLGAKLTWRVNDRVVVLSTPPAAGKFAARMLAAGGSSSSERQRGWTRGMPCATRNLLINSVGTVNNAATMSIMRPPIARARRRAAINRALALARLYAVINYAARRACVSARLSALARTLHFRCR